jgi:hypothetical protein
MDKCVEKKVVVLGKIASKMKIKDGIVGLMKKKKKNKRKVFEVPPCCDSGGD